jgi:hypothetical protein
MKKQILLIGFFIFSLVSFAQVGIGNVDPQTTLDVTGATDGAGVASGDGVMVPRVTNLAAANIAAADGALVFLTADSGADLRGFYYWSQSGTDWLPVGGGAAALPVSNFLTKNPGTDSFVASEISTAVTSIEFITSAGTFALGNLTLADAGKIIFFTNNSGGNATVAFNGTNSTILNTRAGGYLWNGTKWLKLSYV